MLALNQKVADQDELYMIRSVDVTTLQLDLPDVLIYLTKNKGYNLRILSGMSHQVSSTVHLAGG